LRSWYVLVLSTLAAVSMQVALGQGLSMSLPKTVAAGNAFSIQSTGSGKATLYIVGLGQVLKRDVQLGGTMFFPSGSLYNAGHYIVALTGDFPTESGSLDVLPASQPAELSFLAKPSRLPVGLHDGITGAVYVFDAYRNLTSAEMPVSFELSSPSGAVQKRTVMTHDGAAWTTMDSTSRQGTDRFVARVGEVSSARIVGQVPGDPCSLKMSVQQSSKGIELTTEPVRDCNGNAVPDGTIVTFTETYGGRQSTADIPVKKGIAVAQMLNHDGATISVASGVVLGNQIHMEK